MTAVTNPRATPAARKTARQTIPRATSASHDDQAGVIEPTASLSAKRLTRRAQLGKLALHDKPRVAGAEGEVPPMSEQNQNTADDVEGHGRARSTEDTDRDDVEGHGRARSTEDTDRDDVEGHGRARSTEDTDRDDDVEGHARHV
jgi:hypothetical protein